MKRFIPIIFLVVIESYFLWGSWSFFEILFPGFPFSLYFVLSILLLLCMVHVFRPLIKDPQGIIRGIGSYWMGIFSVLFALLPLFHIVLFAVSFLMRPSAFLGLQFICSVIFFAVTLFFALAGFLHARHLKIKEYDITLENCNLLEELHLVLISDIHLGAVHSEKQLFRIKEEINRLSPDLICIAGDLFNNNFDTILDVEDVKETLQDIHAPYGVFFAPGNHDAGSTFSQMCSFAEASGLICLYDNVSQAGDRALIWGRLDERPIGGFSNLTRKDDYILPVENPNHLPVIVLDHTPSNVTRYGNDVDLILCGHTHKGQVFPGRLVTKRMFPVDYGYYRKDATSPQVIVTSGAGIWGMPMRIASDCEIVSIHIRR